MRELGQSHKLNGENLPASSASSLPSDKSEKVKKEILMEELNLDL